MRPSERSIDQKCFPVKRITCLKFDAITGLRSPARLAPVQFNNWNPIKRGVMLMMLKKGGYANSW